MISSTLKGLVDRGRSFCLGCRQKETPTLLPELVASYVSRFLFQRAVDRRELRVEVRADAIHHGDDRERDAGRDQSVLDGGRAGLVFPEFANELLHVTHPWFVMPVWQTPILIKTT